MAQLVSRPRSEGSGPAPEGFPGERIAVVIPAYRVAESIASVVRGIPAWVFAITVVDDASPDDTAQVVSSIGDGRVHVLRLATNRGVGGAVLAGYRHAAQLGATIIVKMDGDGQMDPQHLPLLIEPIAAGESDYCKGNRFFHLAHLRKMPPRRRLGNITLSFLTKLSSGYWDVFDPANGYTALDASIVPLLDDTHIDERWFFETSLLIELGTLGATVRDVYLPAIYAGEVSNLSEFHVVRRFPGRLLAAFARRLWLEYFVRDFGAFSLFLVCGLILAMFGFIWGVWHWVVSNATGVAATTGTVMVAVLPLILGVQLLLQAAVIDIGGHARPRGTRSRSGRL